MSNRVQNPWLPLEAVERAGDVSVAVWGRVYRQKNTVFPSFLSTQGRELLYAPIRLAGEANGQPICWEDEGCYLLSHSDGEAIVNGYAQSQCLIANSSFRVEYDGGARWDIRVLPRGLTVPQIFGLEKCTVPGWNLTRLSLQIPLRKEYTTLYNTWRNCWNGQNGVTACPSGAPLPENGALPAGGICAPFLPALWLGDEKTGLQIVWESDESILLQDQSRAVEILDQGDHWLLQYNLLDALPPAWESPDANVPALCFSLGLIATPVKPISTDYLRWRAVHIDCFTKIKEDYLPFLTGPVDDDNPESVIDRLTRAGVNLLILHEKWNTMQNDWRVPEKRAEEMHQLVRLCHQRGIRVIPYFGYEITSSMPEYNEMRQDVQGLVPGQRENASGWYRVPYQRASPVCYRSAWAERFLKGVIECLDTFHFDGVYLDGTTNPRGCANARHGCGYTDAAGARRATYPIFAVRELMQRIYRAVHARGGIVNPHPDGATIPFINGFSDLLWDGEHLQTRIRDEGLSTFSLPYFRAEYLGTNLGVPVQFIVYEFPGVWSFDMALSISMLHGIYPRPNSIGHPLDVMERIWAITGAFGIAEAQFTGYWENAGLAQSDDMRCKASFYSRKQADGTLRVLLIASNPTADCSACVLTLRPQALQMARLASVYDFQTKKYLPPEGVLRLSLGAYHYALYEIVLMPEENE